MMGGERESEGKKERNEWWEAMDNSVVTGEREWSSSLVCTYDALNKAGEESFLWEGDRGEGEEQRDGGQVWKQGWEKRRLSHTLSIPVLANVEVPLPG